MKIHRLSSSLISKTILSIFTVLLPIVIIFLYTYNENKKYLKEQAIEHVTIMAESYEGEVYLFLEMIKRRVHDFSSDGFIKKELNRIVSGGGVDKKSSINSYLREQKMALDHTVEKISLISQAGIVIASTENEDIGKDLSEASYYIEGKTRPALECNCGEKGVCTFVVSAPVVNSDTGEGIGVIANYISHYELTRLLTGELFGDFGAISFKRESRKAMDVYIITEDRMFVTKPRFMDETMLESIYTKPVEEALTNKKEYTGFYKNYRGEEVAGASMLIPPMKWILIVEINANEILQPMTLIRERFKLSFAVTAGLIGILMLVFVNMVVMPVRNIAQAARELSNENYDVIIPVRSRDEIGLLAKAFNDMTHRIISYVRELINSEKRLQTIIDNTAAVVYLKDLEGKYLLVNSTLEKMLHAAREEIIGKTDFDFFPHDTAAVFRDNDRKVLEADSPLEFEEIAPQDDGIVQNYISVKVPVKDNTGVTYGVCGISVDITDIKEAENRLKEAQSIGRIGSWSFDFGTGAFNCSEQLYDIYGFSPDCVPPRRTGRQEAERINYHDLMNCIHPDDLSLVREKIDNLSPGNSSFSIDHRIITADGIVKHVSRRGMVYFDKNDIPLKMSGTVQDITERLIAEEKRFELQKKYEELLNSLPIGIFRVSREGRFLEMNPSFMKMMDADFKDDLLNYNRRDFFVKDKEQIAKIDKIIALNGFILNEDIEIHTLKGNKFWASFTGIRREDKEGHIYMDCIIQDISERKKLEEQLLHSQKMDAIGRLAGGVAHDFNNILTAIIGYEAILRQKKQDDEFSTKHAEQITNLCNRAVTLTGGLLSFSRKQIVSFKIINLSEILTQEEKILRRLLREDVEMGVSVRDKDLHIKADHSQIEQILMNLTTNARDAMQDGGKITIKAELAEIDSDFVNTHGYGEPGQYVLLTFSDTGAGMNEETKQKMFDPFFTTKEVGKGTGLGLSIIYGIVKQHNGLIDVASALGEGTTFFIYFPLYKGLAEKDNNKLFNGNITGGTETILLAEDQEDVRDVTKRILENSGYKVVDAVDGNDAIEKFKQNKEQVALVILDMIMPKKNGKEALDEIRKIKPGIKAFFLSGYAADIPQLKEIEEEKIDIFLKPFHADILIKKIREILDT